MLGYCGINCDNCRAYQGTVKGDLDLLQQAAGSYWGGAYSASDWVCLGCQPPDQPFLAKYCANCRFRTCAASKGITSCAACPGYEGCTPLHEFIKGEGEVLTRTMALLRQRFQERQARG